MATALSRLGGAAWTRAVNGNGRLEVFVLFDPVTEDESDVESAAAGSLPAVYQDCILESYEFEEESYGLVKCVASYRRAELTAASAGGTVTGNFSEFSFEIESQSTKITSSFAVVSSGALSGYSVPNNDTLLNVNKDGIAEGIDIPQMNYSFSEVHHFSEVSNSYRVTLAGLVGTVNFGGSFRGYAAGTCCLTGVSGSRTGDDFWQLRYRWAVIPNMDAESVGPLTVSKYGWDYIEYVTREVENTTDKRRETKLIGYKVHRVLRSGGNFSALGLGTT